ncbi:hypothetical protein [Engelhardtia mirabilis]|uniref:hypothetical protein n=1 Tax=Engelhardtia mirabilis TaxID=2528011 RepID=UPI0011A1D695
MCAVAAVMLSSASLQSGSPAREGRIPSVPVANEPEAPLAVEIHLDPLQGGRARVRYEVSPLVQCLDASVELRPSSAARVVEHVAPPAGPRARRESVQGLALVEVDGPASLELVFRIALADPGGIDGRSTFSIERQVLWGELPVVDSTQLVYEAGEVTAQVPSILRPRAAVAGGGER